MSSYSDGLREAAQNAFCDVSRAGVSGGLLFAGLRATSVPGFLAGLAIAAAAAHLYAAYCNQPLPPDGFPQRPFRGGQCPDVRYNVPIYYTYVDNQSGATGRQGGTFQVWGKITRAELFIDEAAFNTTFFIVDGQYDTDVYALANEGFEIGDGMPRYSFEREPVICTPIDGSPDLCGDPPIIPPPLPDPDEYRPAPFVYIDNDGNTINVPVSFNFEPPQINFDGTINMPVNVRFDVDPTLNIGGDINFNTGDFTINVGGGGEPPPPPPSEPKPITRPPGEPPPTPPGVPEPPEPPEPGEPVEPVLVIRACIVTVTQEDTEASIIFQDDNPNIYVPSLGHISFLCEVAGAFGWTTDIPIKNRQQFVVCPWQYGAIDVRGTAKGGAVFNIEKIYDELPVEPAPL